MKIIFSHQTHILCVHKLLFSTSFFPPIAKIHSTIHLYMFTGNDSNCYFTFWYQHSLVHRILRYIRQGQMHRPLAMVAQCLIHFQLLQDHPSLSPYPLEHTLGAAARAAFLAMLFTAFLKAMIANWYDQCVVAVIAWRVELAARCTHTKAKKDANEALNPFQIGIISPARMAPVKIGSIKKRKERKEICID